MAAPITRDYETLYGVGLLDDIHNYFPAILYEPEQFRNLGQLLMYIQRQTHRRFDLFTFGQTAYNERRPQPPAPPARPPVRIPISTAMPPLVAANPPVPPTPEATLSTPVVSVNLGAGAGTGFRPPSLHSLVHQFVNYTDTNEEEEEEDEEEVERFEQVHQMLTGARTGITTQTLSGNNTIQLLSALLQLPTTPLINTNSFPAGFLNPVVVRPTEDQITATTTLSTLETASPENCAICQDSIGANQEQREINHCHHAFHRGCIDTWFQENVHCPVCRHDIRENSSSQETSD